MSCGVLGVHVCVRVCVSKVSQNRRKVESCSTGTTFLHSACVEVLGDDGGEGVGEMGAIEGVRVDAYLRVGRVCLFVRRAVGLGVAVYLLGRRECLVLVRAVECAL